MKFSLSNLNPFKQKLPPNAHKITDASSSYDNVPTQYYRLPKTHLHKAKQVENTYFEHSSFLSGRKWTVVQTKFPKLSSVYRFFRGLTGSKFIAGGEAKRLIIASSYTSDVKKTEYNKEYADYNLTWECEHKVDSYLLTIEKIKSGLHQDGKRPQAFDITDYTSRLNSWL